MKLNNIKNIISSGGILGLINFLVNENKIIPTGRIINLWEHNGWGNSIYFIDFKNRKLAGHLQDKPEVGDEIRSEMDSGRIARFIVDTIDYCYDPRDMFFCTVKDLTYLDKVK